MDDTPFKEKISEDIFKSLKQVVIGCPELPDPFYTHLFVSPVDRKTKLEGAWAGNGHGVREALLQLKGRKGSTSGRVARFGSVQRNLHTFAQLTITCSAASSYHKKPPKKPPMQMDGSPPRSCHAWRHQSCQNCAVYPSRHQPVQNPPWQHRQPGRYLSQMAARSREVHIRDSPLALAGRILRIPPRSQVRGRIPNNAARKYSQLRILALVETF